MSTDFHCRSRSLPDLWNSRSRERISDEFGGRSSTEVEAKVCVSSAIPLGANYVGGCSHKSDFTIDLTEAFDFLDSQATGGVFQLLHEFSCLMSGPERSILRMTLQLM